MIPGVFGRLLGLPELDAPENRRLMRFAMVLGLCAVVARIIFWLYTGRVWEDALVTMTHTLNCVEGHGLTHHASEPRVQGYTSPWVMLLALCGDFVRAGAGLWAVRWVSILCAAPTVVYGMALMLRLRLVRGGAGLIAVCGFGAWLAFEHHQILLAVGGLESQFAMLALLASACFLVTPEQPVRLGVALGLCMWVRPDFGPWVILAGLWVLLRAPRMLPRVVAASAAVYVPWMVFSWVYYGGLLPNTIEGKMYGYPLWWKDPALTFAEAKRIVADRLTYNVFSMVGPSYHSQVLHSAYLGSFPWGPGAAFLSAAGVAFALVRRQWAILPVGVFMAAYTVYLVFFVQVHAPQYLAPVAGVVLMLALGAIGRLPGRFGVFVVGGVVAVHLFAILAALPFTFECERSFQCDIEDGVRKPLGLYLREAARPDQTIACECLGYVGYYSRREVYDWPGLGSRKVTQFLKENPDKRRQFAVYDFLHPDFLVLRAFEAEQLRAQMDGAWLDRDYSLAKVFETRPEAVRWTGHGDAKFLVFRRIEGPE